MIKKTLDYKLINIAILLLIVLVFYNLNNLFNGIFSTIFSVAGPFIFAFILAYAIEPVLDFLIKKNIPKNIAIVIIIAGFILSVIVIFALVLPVLFEQLTGLFNTIMTFLKDLIEKNNLELGPLQKTLSSSFDDILKNTGNFISEGALGVINASMGIFTSIFVVFSAMIYFLIDMKNIRIKIKEYLFKNSLKVGNYVVLLDKQMKLYFVGFFRIILITMVEYTILYTIIGHPHALLIGVLAGLGNLIPIFGALIVNIIGVITAIAIGPALLIKTVIVLIGSSILDSYVINPLVYKKTNQVPPILILFSVFAGASLFGFIGVVASIPATIIILATYKYFKTEIDQKIEEVKKHK